MKENITHKKFIAGNVGLVVLASLAVIVLIATTILTANFSATKKEAPPSQAVNTIYIPDNAPIPTPVANPTPTPVSSAVPIKTPVIAPVPTTKPILAPVVSAPTPSPTPVSQSKNTITISINAAADQIVIMQDDGTLTSADSYGTKSFNMQNITKRFYESYPDSYDFLAVYGDFSVPLGGYGAVSNQVKGIGAPIYDNSKEYGSVGKLKGVIGGDLTTIYSGGQQTLQYQMRTDLYFLAHEIGHASCCFINSTPVITTKDSMYGGHWRLSQTHPHNVNEEKIQGDTDLDIMGGADFIDNLDGTFTMRRFSSRDPETLSFYPLTLYLMGLIPSTEVPATSLLEFANPINTIGATAIATKSNISIENIINQNGERLPESSISQKNFNAAIILITEKDKTPSSANLMQLQNLANNFPWFWAKATRCTSTMSTSLDRNNGQNCASFSQSESSANIFPNMIPANNTTTAIFTVILKDKDGKPLSGRDIQVFPDTSNKNLIPDLMNTLNPQTLVTTDNDGRAIFTLRSYTVAKTSYFIIADGIYLQSKPEINFTSE